MDIDVGFFFFFGIELVFRCNNLTLIGQHLSDGLDVNCVNVSIINVLINRSNLM